MYYLLQSIISYFPQEMWKLDYLLLSHLNLYMISRWKTLLRVFSGVNVDIYSCYECDIVSYILWCIVLNNLLWGALNKEMNPIEKWVLRWCVDFFMFICTDSLTCSVSALSFESYTIMNFDLEVFCFYLRNLYLLYGWLTSLIIIYDYKSNHHNFQC